MNLSANNQKYRLRWNDYLINWRSSFAKMVYDGTFVDVTLACEGSSIQAHKMILAASSDYFVQLFLTNPCTHPIVILNDIKMNDLKVLIDFIYTGQVTVLKSQLKRVLKLGHTLKIKGLMSEHNDANDLDTNSFNSVNLPFERCSSSKVVKNKVLSDDCFFKKRRRKKRLLFLSSSGTSDNSESEKKSASTFEEGQAKKAKREEEEEKEGEKVESEVEVEELEADVEVKEKEQNEDEDCSDDCTTISSKKDNDNKYVTNESPSSSAKRYFESPIIILSNVKSQKEEANASQQLSNV